MNKFITAVILPGILLFGTSGLDSAELVKFPVGPASWTIEITRTMPPPSGNVPELKDDTLSITQVEVDQDDQKRRTLMKLSNGKNREIWNVVGLKQILTEDSNGRVYFTNGKAPFDAGSFDWLKDEFLQEKKPVKYLRKDCFHYKGEISTQEGVIHYEAWIDSITLFPVALATETETGTFSFKNPSASNLSVPDKFRMPLENKKRMIGLK